MDSEEIVIDNGKEKLDNIKAQDQSRPFSWPNNNPKEDDDKYVPNVLLILENQQSETDGVYQHQTNQQKSEEEGTTIQLSTDVHRDSEFTNYISSNGLNSYTSTDDMESVVNTDSLKRRYHSFGVKKPRRHAWGNLSYAEIITKAIGSSPEQRLTLSQIYDWMIKNIPYFATKSCAGSSAGWKVFF